MEDIERLKEIVVPIAEKHGIARMSLFGSRARGEEHPGSDYDFLVSKGRIRSLLAHASLINDLEDALLTPVDVILDTCDDPEFVQNVKQDEVVLYEQSR